MASTERDPRAAGSERTERTRAIHTGLDQAASLMNSVHAQVLTQVIEAQAWKIHRDIDGFSALREWLVAKFDFHGKVAADIAAIARCARKFTVLSEAATSGLARIDAVAAAVRRLEKTKALRVYAKAPYAEPVLSPFDSDVECPTPEHLIGQYCVHGAANELHRFLDELQAALDSGEALVDGLSEQSLQRLDLVELDNGMWSLDAILASDTGKLFAKFLTTATQPPRQDETDEDGLLPPAANDRAEALHQLLAGYGSSPYASTRHGHTATLNLTVDVETLRGEDTGRVQMLESRPISVGLARLLACEGQVIPSVFDYATGEAIELGRAERLPNVALRRKLELEQPGGCAWQGCGRPVQWTEAHHIEHWADGGSTVAENLILLCRFHHGRIHTSGWSVTKTAPGRALIVHHEGHADGGTDLECGCADWRTDADLDADFADEADNVFPTGLFPSEWGPGLKDELDTIASAAVQMEHPGLVAPPGAGGIDMADIESHLAGGPDRPRITPPPIRGERSSSDDPIPFLSRPGMRVPGERIITAQPVSPRGTGYLGMSGPAAWISGPSDERAQRLKVPYLIGASGRV